VGGQINSGGRIAGIHHGVCRHSDKSKTPAVDYWASIEGGETLRTQYITIGWIRNVGGVGRRGGLLCRLTRPS
jgi:hypothetical protein